MKKNESQREFKKLKSQISQIEEIVHHSKPGALIEHEVAIRKKLKKIKELENEGFKDFKKVYEKYEELLEDISKRMLEDYNKRNGTDFEFHKVLRGKL